MDKNNQCDDGLGGLFIKDIESLVKEDLSTKEIITLGYMS